MSPPSIIILLLSLAVPVVIVVYVMGSLMKGQAKTDELLRTGLAARGRIMQLGTTGDSVAVRDTGTLCD